MLFGKGIKSAIVKSASQCITACYVATAYCKASSFEELLITSSLQAKIKILVLRWELNDLITGVSDLEVYALAKKNGWKIYLNQKLHAKVYRFDNDCYIGSANLTNKGITGEEESVNIEVMSNEIVDQNIETWFRQLLNESRELDDELFQLISEEVEMKSKDDIEKDIHQYPLNIQQSIKQPKVDKLYTIDFFWLDEPNKLFSNDTDEQRGLEHDLFLLRLLRPISKDDVSFAFHQSKVFQWLLGILLSHKEIYFGELTNLLHDALQDDPAPYRQTVKILLNNLINWVEKYSRDVIEIDTPNVSTCLKLHNPLY